MFVESFGRYRIEALLGRGGMGEVHRAFDTRNERTVALKRLRSGLSDEDGFRVRFQRESRMVARLSSPHVIPIHDSGEIDGRLYLDMRLVRGRDLATLLSETGSLRPARASVIVGQVADALHSAHEDELIHRDVKPSNVLLDEHTASGNDFAYLVDFGIAKSTEPGRDTGLTGTGAAIGTLAYMSPEMFLGAVVDRRADIYALACLTFELLSGRPPFGASGMALMYEHLNAPPPRLSHVRAGLPGALDEVLARGMAKRPDDRFRTATDLAVAVARAASGDATQAPPVPSWSLPPPTPAGAVTSWPGTARTAVVDHAPPRTRRRMHPGLIATIAVLGTMAVGLVVLVGIAVLVGLEERQAATGTAATTASQTVPVRNDPESLAALRAVFAEADAMTCHTIGTEQAQPAPLATLGCQPGDAVVYYQLWPRVEDATGFFERYRAGRISDDGRDRWTVPGSASTDQGPYFSGSDSTGHLIAATFTGRRYSVLVVAPTREVAMDAFSKVGAVPVEQVPF